MNELIEKNCVVYLKRSNNYLKLKESSGVDIPGEIEKEVEKLRISETETDILNRSVSDNYMYPMRYNDEHEITRYFDFTYISSDVFLKQPTGKNGYVSPKLMELYLQSCRKKRMSWIKYALLSRSII